MCLWAVAITGGLMSVDLDDVNVREVMVCVSACVERAVDAHLFEAGRWHQLAMTNAERVLDDERRAVCQALVQQVGRLVSLVEASPRKGRHKDQLLGMLAKVHSALVPT